MDYKKINTEKLFSDQILNNSRSMISIINRNYIYEKVNKPFCKAHNCKSKSIVGKSVSDIWGTDTFQIRIRNKIDLCLSGKTVRYKAAFGRTEAETKTYDVIFRPIKSEEGLVTRIIADTFEITDNKSLQSDTAVIQQELTSLKSDFKNHLQQTHQLATVGLITEGIVHDFNNIIATISGYAELIHDELPKGSPLSEKTEKIIAASDRARLLSQRILNISDNAEKEKTIVNVNKILRETLELIKSLSPFSIKFSVNIPEEEFNVLADPSQLFRVFLNIITNALQSMKEKGGILTVYTKIVPAGMVKPLARMDLIADEYILVSFLDSGYGIDKSQMKRIFEPFYSGHNRKGGTGLGLYIVNEIVTEMRGEIHVSGKKNSGTLFSIYLPCLTNTRGQS